MQKEPRKIKNVAFISYSHHDERIVNWLQRSLEQYKVPAIYQHPVAGGQKTLAPVFRDATDLTAGVLSDVIEQNLESSNFLIVVCLHHAARSEWVSKEVQFFID